MTPFWDWDFARDISPALGVGLGVTIAVTFAAAVLAICYAVLTIIVYREFPVGRKVLYYLNDFLRGTPLIVQVFAVYFVLPEFGITLTALTAGIFTLGLNYGAHMSEPLYEIMSAVPTAQWEAAEAASMTKSHTWRRIILPLVFRNARLTLGTYVIGMYKETALLFVIGVPVLLAEAMTAASISFRYVEPYTLMGLLYLSISATSGWLVRRWSERMEA